MRTLIIRHVNADVPAHFQASSKEDGRCTDSVPILSPIAFPVDGRPDSDLQRQLQWYLEDFLAYPYPPETEHAERVLKALKAWGQDAFNALFNNYIGTLIFEDARREGFENLHLVIASDNAQVLGWPWEALESPQAGRLAHTCQIERRLNTVLKPDDLPHAWPNTHVNILLVTARPFKEDVRFRSISRPLVELIDKQDLPAEVTLLRPPTLDNLRTHLHEHPNHYHIVHFDGHGSYGEDPGSAVNPHALGGTEGHLIFEDAKGQPDAISADQLSVLLREYHIPTVVLNACQSAMVDGRAADPFASVAAALLKAGIRNVVAMAYSLYVSGAQVFLPAFYRELFHSGDVARASRAGRQGMLQKKGRVCARGHYDLEDWLVPVVYQNEPFDFAFATRAKIEKADGPELPAEARDSENPYGFIGRDGAVLALERAMHRPPAGLLIQGLGGIGKTTLARGFLQWLRDTHGLGLGCSWFTFQNIRSAEHVFNQMGMALFGPQFNTASMDEKLNALVDVFQENPFLIVWDNFEVVQGIPGTSVTATLASADRELLKGFLARLRGGRTKVIITSRSDEDWLGDTNRYEIPIGGLQGEERWDYCEVILRDRGLTINRADPDLVILMDLLAGHPLAMRVIVPRLAEKSARQLIAILQSNLTALGTSGDPAQDRLFATLHFAEQSLSAELRPILVPLALHERFVDTDYLEAMGRQVDPPFARSAIDQACTALASSGLLNDHGHGVFELHPALTGFLRATRDSAIRDDSRERWHRAFVELMARLADALTSRELHEQRVPFWLHGANFHVALREAERLRMGTAFAALVQSLGAYAVNTRSFQEAAHLFARHAAIAEQRGESQIEAVAYHQLGTIAQLQRDLDVAQRWYLKSLAISEKQGNEHHAASTYHQLGIIAQELRDFDDAQRWCLKSLAIKEKHGNEHGAAITYHLLGIIAQEQRDFDDAERWYLKSLAISEKQRDEHRAASTYHQLGIIAQLQRDFDAAQRWYLLSLAIEEKQGDEHAAASTYHQLGMIAQEQRDFDDARRWYLKSLAISEKHGNEHHAASTYQALGIIAQEQRDFDAAERWYLKALVIFVKVKDTHAEEFTRYALERLRNAGGPARKPSGGQSFLS